MRDASLPPAKTALKLLDLLISPSAIYKPSMRLLSFLQAPHAGTQMPGGGDNAFMLASKDGTAYPGWNVR